VILLGSGSIRSAALGPLVTLGDLLACFPYDDTLTRYTISGAKLKRLFRHIMRPENRRGDGECYQVNSGVRAVYDDVARQLEALELNGEPVDDARLYTICLQGFHSANSAKFLDLTGDELLEDGRHKVISTSARDVMTEFLRNSQNASRKVEGRLVYRSAASLETVAEGASQPL
jgi:5'-nucleotidase